MCLFFFFFFVTILTNSWGSSVKKVTTKQLGCAWTAQSSPWFLCCLLTLFPSARGPCSPSAALSLSLASGSDKNPNDVTSVTQHLPGHHPCHLHTNEGHTECNSTFQLLGEVNEQQRQRMVMMENPQKSRNMCWEFWDLGCLFLHSTGKSLWWLLSPDKMFPYAKNLQFQCQNCQSKGEERRAREEKC